MNHPALAEPRTKEQWRTYVASEPPPRPTLPGSFEEYLALPDVERLRLERDRTRYHSALVIVNTPAMKSIHKSMRVTLLMNERAEPGARPGLIVDGQATLGKSTIVKTFARTHELQLRAEFPERFDAPYVDYIPVVYINIPAKATPKALSQQFADYLGVPTRRTATQSEVTNAVLKALEICGTELVIIDDIHFLDCSQKDGRVANDHLKYLQNHVVATFIYAGVNVTSGGLFSEGSEDRSTQTSGRFALLRVQPFGQAILAPAGRPKPDAPDQMRDQMHEWASVVKTMEDALVLYHHDYGSLVKDWRYLLERTGGRISSLSRLIRTAAILAILDAPEIGAERIDRDVLERAFTDMVAEDQRREREEARKLAEEADRHRAHARGTSGLVGRRRTKRPPSHPEADT